MDITTGTKKNYKEISMNIKIIIANIIAKIALTAVKISHNTVASWYLYQPEEPKALKRKNDW